jgi:protocatechuate 3,4-dioxygenase alpha subunit
MSAKPQTLGQTPSQTVGPYFAYGLTPAQYGYAWTSIAGQQLADETTPGTRIRIEGQVLDGKGQPIDDALVEIWQADGNGRHAGEPGSNSGFAGFGRCGTGTLGQGRYAFDTVKPGVATVGDAPHVNLILQMRGLLGHLFTRIYFADEADANAADPVLLAVPEDRRGTLVALTAGKGVYRFDIHMQGDRETVFLDL